MSRGLVYVLIVLAGPKPAAAADVIQTTTGWCSPTQYGIVNVVICKGVDPRAMKRLNGDLDRMDLSLRQKTAEADEWARNYHILDDQFEIAKKQLAATGEDATLVQAVQDLLHEGKLEEARKIYDRLIVSDEGNVDRAAQDYFDRATLLSLQFRVPDAMPDYAKAYQYRPSNPIYADGYAATAYRERSYREAERGWTNCLQLYRDLAQRDPGAYRPNVAQTLNNLGALYSDTGRLADAEKAYTEALAIKRDLAQRDPGAYRPDVANTLNNLGAHYSQAGRFADAEKALTEALAIQRELAAGSGAYKPDVAAMLNNLANLYRLARRFADAEKLFTEALVMQRELAAHDPDAYRPDVALSLTNLAVI
jgi:tetratricopeptide (TPR) repeat protein